MTPSIQHRDLPDLHMVQLKVVPMMTGMEEAEEEAEEVDHLEHQDKFNHIADKAMTELGSVK